MPIVNGNILPFNFGASPGFGIRALALDSTASIGTLAASYAAKSATLALDSTASAGSLAVNEPNLTTLSAITLALDSNQSLAALRPIRNLSSAELALDSRASSGGELSVNPTAGVLSAEVLALDSTGSTADLLKTLNLASADLSLDSTGSTGGELSAGVFSPSDISSLALWLDAGVGVTTNGSGEVTEWQDQSGNSRNFTSSSGTRPSYNSSDANLNNEPSISFDAGTAFTDGDGLDLSTEAIIGDGTQNCAMFAAVYLASSHPASTVLAFVYYEYNAADASDLNAQNWNLFARENVSGTDLRVDKGGNGTDNGAGGTLNYGSAHIMHYFTGPNQATDLHNVEALVVGDDGAGGGSNTTAPLDTTPANPTSGSHIGRRADDNFGRRWNGEIAEIIIYKKALTKQEANDVNAYLGDKYGITVGTF
jgi:hypothetical protein